jgi:tetratricopeptide (TPR) repeat protein
LRATDGAIAVRNLDAQIDSLEHQLPDPPVRQGLVDALLSRGQFLGSISDYERASTVAEALAAAFPKDPKSFAARAHVRATFHRFDDALADLGMAERLGLPSVEVASSRATIFAAVGKLDEAAALSAHDEAQLGVMELAGAGVLAGDLGKLDDATRLLDMARAKYRDVSPFPLAWIDAQQGAVLERYGHATEARTYYARAVTLLPAFARAAAHLATLSSPDEAIKILQPSLARADDPEVIVALADALRRAGRRDEAASRLASAIARYDVLMTKHPEAFADHAALMWLGEGKSPARALPLAQQNAITRPTAAAFDLLLSAALAAKDDAETCRAARAIVGLKYATPDQRAVATTVAAKCPAKS